MSREYLSVASALDLILQARVAESADLLSQRLKSLESMGNGVHYSIAQRMELLPSERGMIASAAETHEAARRAREEEKVMQKAARGGFRSAEGGTDSGSYGIGLGKGKGKRGKGDKGVKGQEQKGDPKKGVGDR